MKKIIILFAFLFIALWAVITFFSRDLYQDIIEKDLTANIRESLDASGYENVEFEVDHHHVSLSGQVGSEEEKENIIGAIDRAWGAYVADTSGLRTKPLLPPTFFAERLEGDVLRLTGEIPNEAVRDQLVAAAKNTEGIVDVKDELKIAEVAVPEWADATAAYVPDLFAQSNDAKLSIDAEGVDVSGIVPDQEIHDRLAATAKALPASSVSFDEALEVAEKDPAKFQLQRKGAEILLTGTLPDEATQKALVEATQQADPEAKVIDETTVSADVAVPEWGASLPAATAELVSKADDEIVFADENGVRLSGIVPNEEAKAHLVGLVEGVPVADQLKVLPWQDPSWKVASTPEQISVTGELPDKPTQDSLVALVRDNAGDKKVVDETKITPRTHPAWWGDHAKAVLPELAAASPDAHLLEYGADKLIVRGQSPDPATRDALVAKVGEALPEAVKPSVELVTPDAPVVPQTPAEFKVVSTEGKIVVTGVLPDTKTQEQLVATVKKTAGETPVEDKTTVAENITPIWWQKHFGQLVPQLAAKSPQSYMARYTADKVIARAEVEGEDAKANLSKMVAQVPEAITSVPEITVVPSALPVEPAFVEQLALLPVYFGTDSSDILADEAPKIEKAAGIIKEAKSDLGLTVGGYADLRGSAEYNKALSLRRANAVRDRLIELGVPADKLTVNHFGEDTSEVARKDLWKSRRVVISLTESN